MKPRPNIVVVNTPANWPFETPEIELVAARDYLTDRRYLDVRGARVYNLCRSNAYQSLGYYVSLLAEARGHRCLPSLATTQDLRSTSIIRVASQELDELIQKSLARLTSPRFELSIYFGRNLAKRYDRLSARLFNLYPAPLLRVYFARKKTWEIQRINIISGHDVPDSHRPFVAEVASQYFSRRRAPSRRRSSALYDLAILHDPDEAQPPSDPPALAKFIKAASDLGMRAELIRKDDAARLAEYDALFIRETTGVDHHTYRLARRAQEAGLVVIDDPDSILRCTNKVYLAEVLAKHRVAAPRTIIAHRDNLHLIGDGLGFPVILKRPDSSFSLGVVKVDDPAALETTVREFLDDSEMIVAQEYSPSTFDWRVGILDRRPLYVCKYHMAGGHWQIINWKRGGSGRYGRVEAIPLRRAPEKVVRAALRAARIFGDGLYGVDLKEVGGKTVVIEVNDNPTIETDCEDRILGDELYRRVVSVFLERIRALRGERNGSVRA